MTTPEPRPKNANRLSPDPLTAAQPQDQAPKQPANLKGKAKAVSGSFQNNLSNVASYINFDENPEMHDRIQTEHTSEEQSEGTPEVNKNSVLDKRLNVLYSHVPENVAQRKLPYLLAAIHSASPKTTPSVENRHGYAQPSPLPTNGHGHMPGSWSWRARDHQERTGVHPFNRTLADLQNMADENAAGWTAIPDAAVKPDDGQPTASSSIFVEVVPFSLGQAQIEHARTALANAQIRWEAADEEYEKAKESHHAAGLFARTARTFDQAVARDMVKGCEEQLKQSSVVWAEARGALFRVEQAFLKPCPSEEEVVEDEGPPAKKRKMK